jgi:hypothetical protein
MGMFAQDTIDNDLKLVDTVIRDYWALAPMGNKATQTKEQEK